MYGDCISFSDHPCVSSYLLLPSIVVSKLPGTLNCNK